MSTKELEDLSLRLGPNKPAWVLASALWFSRHVPSLAQLDEINTLGYILVDLGKGMAQGSINVQSEQDVDDVLLILTDSVKANGASAIFGVFPAPIQERMAMSQHKPGIPCFSAWNIQRTDLEGKASFTHKRWCRVGDILL